MRSERHCFVKDAASTENAPVKASDVVQWVAVTSDGSIDVFSTLRSGAIADGEKGGVIVRRDKRVTLCLSEVAEALRSGRGLCAVCGCVWEAGADREAEN